MLRNVNGILTMYRVRRSGLRWVEPDWWIALELEAESVLLASPVRKVRDGSITPAQANAVSRNVGKRQCGLKEQLAAVRRNGPA